MSDPSKNLKVLITLNIINYMTLKIIRVTKKDSMFKQNIISSHNK